MHVYSALRECIQFGRASEIILVCSLKNMCVPNFILFENYVSELRVHAHLCPHRNCTA